MLVPRPPKRSGTSSPDTIVIRSETLGLTIDCETAAAHWHGKRVAKKRCQLYD